MGRNNRILLIYFILLGIISIIWMNSNSLEGTYLSNDNLLYKSFTFKGKSTVVIKDDLIGFDFVTNYERDGNYIKIKTDKSDLLLEIVTRDSLIGKGFAKGSYVKVK